MNLGLNLTLGRQGVAAGGGSSSLVSTSNFTYQGPEDGEGNPVDGAIIGPQTFWLRRETSTAEFLFPLAVGNYLISADNVAVAPTQSIIRIQIRDSTGMLLDINAASLEGDGSLAPTAFTVAGTQTRFSAITAPRGAFLTNFSIVAA